MGDDLSHNGGECHIGQTVACEPGTPCARPSADDGNIDFDFQFEMREAVAYDAGAFRPVGREGRLCERLAA